jgi:aspartokinase/homoserine dehydrogenase 1
MRVIKFGGSSVANAERIRRVVSIIGKAASKERVVVVTSALAGVTDALVSAANRAVRDRDASWDFVESLHERHLECLRELGVNGFSAEIDQELRRLLFDLGRLLEGAALLGECPPVVRDRILATGERLAAPLLVAALRSASWDARAIDAAELIVTDSSFGDAEVDHEATAKKVSAALGKLPKGVIPVVPGFIGGDDLGRTTTLGRGGSDYTASILGAVLGADKVEIWTDVSGVLTAPPKLVAGARTLPRLTYEEARELAYYGARVLHPKTVQPLVERRIPVAILNTFEPEHSGTTVNCAGEDENSAVRAVTVVESASTFSLVGVPSSRSACARWLAAVAALPTDLLLVSQASAEHPGFVVTSAANAEEVERALNRLRAECGHGARIERRDGVAVVVVVGHSILQQPAVVARVLVALARSRVEVLAASAGASPHTVAVLIDGSQAKRAVETLHEALLVGPNARGEQRGEGDVVEGQTAGTTGPTTTVPASVLRKGGAGAGQARARQP